MAEITHTHQNYARYLHGQLGGPPPSPGPLEKNKKTRQSMSPCPFRVCDGPVRVVLDQRHRPGCVRVRVGLGLVPVTAAAAPAAAGRASARVAPAAVGPAGPLPDHQTGTVAMSWSRWLHGSCASHAYRQCTGTGHDSVGLARVTVTVGPSTRRIATTTKWRIFWH